MPKSAAPVPPDHPQAPQPRPGGTQTRARALPANLDLDQITKSCDRFSCAHQGECGFEALGDENDYRERSSDNRPARRWHFTGDGAGSADGCLSTCGRWCRRQPYYEPCFARTARAGRHPRRAWTAVNGSSSSGNSTPLVHDKSHS